MTGRRFLTGYYSDEQQYRALMDNAATFASAYQLIPGMALSTPQKEVAGELFGGHAVRQIVPDGTKIARVPGVGENGIDDLYRVNRSDVDFVVVEYKFVGDDAKLGSQRLGNALDGKQGSESWILGSDRIVDAVGRELAPDVELAVRQGRYETLVVTTRSDGSTVVEVLNAAGKPKPIDTSKIIVPSLTPPGGRR